MDFLQTLAGWLRELWPFTIVEQWERGVFYLCGRARRQVGPGLHVVVPFFTSIRTAPVVPAIVGTPRIDLTLRDGTSVSFAATATVQVHDVSLAINAVDSYRQTTQELLASVLADQIMRVAPDRVTSARGRRWLLERLTAAAAAEAATYGVSVSKVRFTSFVAGVRTFRLLQDTGTVAGW